MLDIVDIVYPKFRWSKSFDGGEIMDKGSSSENVDAKGESNETATFGS